QFGCASSGFGIASLQSCFFLFAGTGTTNGVIVATQDGRTITFRTGGLTSANDRLIIDSVGQVSIITPGRGLSVKTGANCKMGTGTLSSGTVVISTTAVTVNSFIFLTDTSAGIVNVGALTVSAITPGANFTVKSTNVADTGTFNWLIIEPS